MGEGFPPLVASVCEENTMGEGFPPSLRLCGKET